MRVRVRTTSVCVASIKHVNMQDDRWSRVAVRGGQLRKSFRPIKIFGGNKKKQSPKKYRRAFGMLYCSFCRNCGYGYICGKKKNVHIIIPGQSS